MQSSSNWLQKCSPKSGCEFFIGFNHFGVHLFLMSSGRRRLPQFWITNCGGSIVGIKFQASASSVNGCLRCFRCPNRQTKSDADWSLLVLVSAKKMSYGICRKLTDHRKRLCSETGEHYQRQMDQTGSHNSRQRRRSCYFTAHGFANWNALRGTPSICDSVYRRQSVLASNSLPTASHQRACDRSLLFRHWDQQRNQGQIAVSSRPFPLLCLE